MPAIATEQNPSTGHDCFPPTNAIGPYSTRTRINGKYIQLKGVTMYAAHTCNKTTHPPEQRKVIEGSDTIKVEGIAVARIGDMIACGDAVAKGSDNTFGGG